MKIKSKNYKWGALILVIVISGIILDILGNNYHLVFEKIKIPTQNNQTEEQTIVSTPLAAQAYRFGANFCYGLAITLFATIFVARKLEQDQKEKHKKELEKLRDAVNINVFDALFKTLIPDEIFKIVKTELIENKSIRKRAHWGFIFEEVPDGIQMTAISHYELHNVSKQPISNPVNITMAPISSDEQKIKKAQCLSSKETELISFDPSNESRNKNINIEKLASGEKNVSYTVTIPPNDYIVSTFEFTTIFKGKIFDAQYTKHPIIDLNINAVFPKGYKFNIQSLLSSEPKLISEGDTHKNFKVEGGILPRQGIIYTLEKVTCNTNQLE